MVVLFINIFWILLMLLLTRSSSSHLRVLHSNILGFVFLFVYGSILIFQFFASCVHRFGTFCQVVASTSFSNHPYLANNASTSTLTSMQANGSTSSSSSTATPHIASSNTRLLAWIVSILGIIHVYSTFILISFVVFYICSVVFFASMHWLHAVFREYSPLLICESYEYFQSKHDIDRLNHLLFV